MTIPEIIAMSIVTVVLIAGNFAIGYAMVRVSQKRKGN